MTSKQTFTVIGRTESNQSVLGSPIGCDPGKQIFMRMRKGAFMSGEIHPLYKSKSCSYIKKYRQVQQNTTRAPQICI